jgi:hypothetical protein
MRIILLVSAISFCAIGSVFLAYIASGTRRMRPGHSRLAEMLAAQTEAELRKVRPAQSEGQRRSA